jgi:signal transduction histidine kinase
LHDGPALRIAALTLQLGLLSQKLPGESQLQDDIEDLQHGLHLALQELRTISDQIYPPLLYEAGLAPTLSELASRARVPVRVEAPDDRFDPAVEAVAYFAVAELLDTLDTLDLLDTNRQQQAATVAVRSDERQHDLTLDITLELATFDTSCRTKALERIQRLGAVVETRAGASTGTIKVRIPCE